MSKTEKSQIAQGIRSKAATGSELKCGATDLDLSGGVRSPNLVGKKDRKTPTAQMTRCSSNTWDAIPAVYNRNCIAYISQL